MIKLFAPDIYYDSIFDIDLNALCLAGIKGLIIDLDNTLVPRNEPDTPEVLKDWLTKAKKIGLNICIVSNNWGVNAKHVSKELGLPLVTMARKPRRGAFEKGMKILKSSKEETAVIGDQIFTDILGGNRLGLKTILVVPLNGKEFFATIFVRKIERLILKRLQKKNLLRKKEANSASNQGESLGPKPPSQAGGVSDGAKNAD